MIAKIKKNYRVQVDQECLSCLKSHGIYAADSATDSEIETLLEELKTDSSVHTWKNLDFNNKQDLHQYLYDFENKKRPTELFYYFSDDIAGGKELVGIGTVAHKISKSFKHDGFPVIARCYIREKFRNQRLYFPVLRQRFEYCQEVYGPKLRAIHLGSQNPRVFSVIKKNLFGLPLIYVGDEYLRQKEDFELVRDYVWFSPSLRDELLSLKKVIVTTNKNFQNLVGLVEKLVTNEFRDTDYSLMKKYVSAIEQELKWSPRTVEGFSQFLDIMDAIGVIEKDKSDMESMTPAKPRSA